MAKKTSSKGPRDPTGVDKIEEEEKKVSYLAWKVFSKDSLKELSALPVNGQLKKMADVLGFQQFKEDTREAIQVELFLTAYSFCIEEGFASGQISAFLTLLHMLLLNCKEKGMSLSANVTELKKLMEGVGSTDRCPMGSWSREQAERVLEYIMTSFLQHYRLYEFVFSEVQDEEESTSKLPVPVPPDPASLVLPPLEEAVHEEFYHKYICPDQAKEENESNLTTGGEDSEKAPVSDDVQADNTKDVFSNMSSSEIQSVLNKVVSKTMESFRTEVGKKISSSEKAHLGRLTHFEKTIQN
jgi:hypothetical protein